MILIKQLNGKLYFQLIENFRSGNRRPERDRDREREMVGEIGELKVGEEEEGNGDGNRGDLQDSH